MTEQDVSVTKRIGRPRKAPTAVIRLPSDVIAAMQRHAEWREIDLSTALQDLVKTSIGALNEYAGDLRPVVVGLTIDELKELDRLRGDCSRPEMIRILLAHHLRP